MAGGANRRLPPLRSPVWPLAAVVVASMVLYASIATTASWVWYVVAAPGS